MKLEALLILLGKRSLGLLYACQKSGPSTKHHAEAGRDSVYLNGFFKSALSTSLNDHTTVESLVELHHPSLSCTDLFGAFHIMRFRVCFGGKCADCLKVQNKTMAQAQFLFLQSHNSEPSNQSLELPVCSS